MMYDTEFSMDLYGNGRNYTDEYISAMLSGDGHFGPMLASLVKNKDFVEKLVVAYEDVMNIAFDIDFAGDRLSEYFEIYGPYLDQHFDRYVTWRDYGGVRSTVGEFKNWVRNRYNSFLPMLVKILDLPATQTNSLQLERTDGGTVMINGHVAPFENGNSPYTWDGTYLGGYKITLTAVPEEGYRFTGWTGSYNGSAESISVNPKQLIKLRASFEKINAN